jgi:hypothetical protein
MKTELRFSDTNAASDSPGRTWGLEGNLFWYLVGGMGLGMTAFFVLIVVMKAGLFISAAAALTPPSLALAYLYGFRQGKPPGYDRDWLEYVVKGRGFAPEPRSAPDLKHPLHE